MTLRWRPSPVTLWILALCSVVEAVLIAADIGAIDVFRLRQTAFEYLGFWPGLLRDWRPNYPGQPALMFLTYSVIHVGPSHFLSNMVTLFVLDAMGCGRMGTGRYFLIYGASIAGGAAGYAGLAKGLVPMVGASGALFGLAGALLTWDFIDRRREGARPMNVVVALALFAGFNVLLWYAMKGQLAWETHLGGFLTGAAVSRLIYTPPERAT